MEAIQASLDHLLQENPMGEARKDAVSLDFDRRLKLEFHVTKITSDAGLLDYVGKSGFFSQTRGFCCV